MKKRRLIIGLLFSAMLTTATPAMAMGGYYDNGIPCNEYTMDNGVMSTTIPMPITVHVDGKYLPTDVNATIRNGRTLMPLRAVGEAMGCIIDWDNETQTASAYDPVSGNIVSFTIGSPNMFVAPAEEFDDYINDPTTPEAIQYIISHLQPLDIPAMNINGRTMLPLRAFAEAFETTVNWDQNLYDVSIDTAETNVEPPNTSIALLPDARRYIEKYYVQTDPNNPIIGSWHKMEYNSDLGGPTLQETFMFVSPYDTGYLCITLSVSDSESYSLNRIIISKSTAQKLTSSSMRVTDQGQTLYYRGPNTGFVGEYIDDYSIINNQLMLIKAVFHIGDSYENMPVYNFVPYDRF